MAKGSDNAFPSILITEGTEPSAPAAGKQRIYIDSTTHHLKRTDSSGVDVDIEAGAGATANGPVVRARRTAGNVTVNSTSWANVDTAIDLTIAADASDIVLIGLSGRWINPASVATYAFLDAVTVVSGSPLNSVQQAGAVSGTSNGVQAWRNLASTANADVGMGGTIAYVVQAGDIVSGNVTFRLRARIFSGTSSHTLVAGTDDSLHWWAWNPYA